MKNIFISLTFCTLFFLSFTLFDDTSMIRLMELFGDYQHENYQQKAYIQTDKEQYFVKDDVWLKAYLTNAETHTADTLSTNLYVDLINENQTVKQTRILRITNGTASGDFKLIDTIPSGIYQMRAYTNWMQNFDNNYIYTKEIRVFNPDSSIHLARKSKRKFVRSADKYFIDFFPESGNLISGINNKVAFKATDGNGNGIVISGKILGTTANVISEIKSANNGLGVFTITPKDGTIYTAIVTFPNGKTKKIKLPEVQKNGFVLQIDNVDEKELKIKILQTKNPNNNNHKLLLFGHSRGKIIYAQQIEMSGEVFENEVSTDDFPSGIAHFTLFTNYREPIAERLVFVYHGDLLDFNTTCDKQIYLQREKVKINMSAIGAIPENTEFCISVAQKNNSQNKPESLSEYLYLKSDLQGAFDFPVNKFYDFTDKNRKDLDLIMMTNGWRRFVWKDVLNAEKSEKKFKVEKGIEINGEITKMLLKFPEPNVKIILSILNQYNDTAIAFSDAAGKFHFKNMNYFDTIDVLLEAYKPDGKHNVIINVNDEYASALPIFIANQLDNKLIAKAYHITKADDRIEPEPENEVESQGFKLHNSADHVIKVGENEMSSYDSVLEYLKAKVPGLHINGDDVSIRNNNSPPLIVIDGMPTDIYALEAINAQDVESIEILKSPSNTAIYGKQGMYGVIAIYTKSGEFGKIGKLEFQMLAYHKVREFYSPKYNNKTEVKPDNRTSLYWNPEIKMNMDGNAEVEFYTSDLIGEFVVTVEAFSSDGKFGSKKIVFTVQ